MAEEKMIARTWGNPSAHPVSVDRAIWAKCRPADERTRLPVAGQRVWYRHDPGGPLVVAQIERVDMETRTDWNVWRQKVDSQQRAVEVKGERVMEMVDDPWPDVYLRMPWGMVVTREARIEGSAGWLPMKAG